ncbi:MAG: glycosyltransferase [Myxococcaceae bacterium]|nr:glycosyltransferase [Myxococcaceae bacterium]
MSLRWRKFGNMLAGAAPLAGAVISMAWLGWSSEAGATSMLWAMATHPIGAIALIQTLYTALLGVLWLKYQPFTVSPDVEWPKVSVIIPAYNEGPMVGRSIRSVAACAYPKDKLEVIVVDDGSRDDTFFHMQHLRREFPDLVKLVRFSGNRGKRSALVAGFRAASGDYVITIDSDSEIDPRTVHEMVTPFLADPKVGGVAGRVAVLNRENAISRMLEVQYTLAFDYGRAAQSVYRTVACCPGALSAFKKSIILPYMDEWENQRFLGRPVNHGEDQALTNIVLRQGFDTVYQRTAVVNTLVPTTYSQLSRMFLRWDRSYIVEGFSFARFMFTRYRENNRLLPIVTFLVSNLRFVLVAVALMELPRLFDTNVTTVGRSVVALALGAIFSAAYYLRFERSMRWVYGVLYALFSVVALQWILPWALVTVRDERWGTR